MSLPLPLLLLLFFNRAFRTQNDLSVLAIVLTRGNGQRDADGEPEKAGDVRFFSEQIVLTG